MGSKTRQRSGGGKPYAPQAAGRSQKQRSQELAGELVRLREKYPSLGLDGLIFHSDRDAPLLITETAWLH